MSEPMLAHVARLYYLRGLTKLTIAERLGISRFKVARLLQRALAEGIVRIEIEEPLPLADELSRRLEEAFRLRLAVVVPEEALASAAARWLTDLLEPDDVLGVAWGRTLSAIAEELEPTDSGMPVVQICGAIPGIERGASPTEVALRFSAKLGGPLHTLPAPATPGADARRELVRHETVRPTLEMFERVTVALVGIGGRPRDRGHILVHVFDGHGRFEAEDLAAIALSLKQLERVRLIAVAGGTAKERAVVGALHTGLLDVLVTDERCAAAALR